MDRGEHPGNGQAEDDQLAEERRAAGSVPARQGEPEGGGGGEARVDQRGVVIDARDGQAEAEQGEAQEDGSDGPGPSGVLEAHPSG